MPRMGGYAPTDHKTRHQTGGRDEVSIASLLGIPAELATHAADLAAHTKSLFEILKTGTYHVSPYGTGTLATFGPLPANRIYATPFLIARNITVDRMAVNVVTAVADYTTGTAAFTNGSAQVVGTGTTFASTHVGSTIKNNTDAVWHTIKSVEDTTHLTLTANYSATGGAAAAYTIRATARLAIYNNGTNLYPGTLLVDAGEIELNATGIVAATISQALTKGLYWVAWNTCSTPSVNTQSVNSSPIGTSNFVGLDCQYYKNSVTYGAFADPFVSGATLTSGYIVIGLRILTLD